AQAAGLGRADLEPRPALCPRPRPAGVPGVDSECGEERRLASGVHSKQGPPAADLAVNGVCCDNGESMTIADTPPHTTGGSPPLKIVEDATCTFCSCVCDDIDLSVQGDRI